MNSIEGRIKNIIASRIRTCRVAKGWTQDRLAEEASLAATFVSRIESGSRLLSVVSLCRLAAALDVDAYELMVSAEKIQTLDYKTKQLIAVLNKSKPAEISLYLEITAALRKKKRSARRAGGDN
ncbi:MAG: helix-turn-helix transcriptional regulator [Euryarchaeota archaeon]|nr:helix-turn-helix transcriptional regulator [Euryarchaeota archaeon]